MSAEMVERAMRAIGAYVDTLPRTSSISPLLYIHRKQMALAVIAAMREPTEDMLSAGDSMMPQIAEGEDITTGRDALADAYPAMIDAALADIEPGDA